MWRGHPIWKNVNVAIPDEREAAEMSSISSSSSPPTSSPTGLEEVEIRRTFSAFDTDRTVIGGKHPDQNLARPLQQQQNQNQQQPRNIPERNSRQAVRVSSLGHSHFGYHHEHHGGFGSFLVDEGGHVYRQRSWITRLTTPHTLETGTAGSAEEQKKEKKEGGRTKKKHKKSKRERRTSFSRMTPGSTLMSIGETCCETENTMEGGGDVMDEIGPEVAPASVVEVKTWPAFRQYKSAVTAASNQRKIARSAALSAAASKKSAAPNKPAVVVLRKATAASGMPATFANIIGNATNRTSNNYSPRQTLSESKISVSTDPSFTLHCIRLAVIDGCEGRACRLLETVFGLPNPMKTSPAAKSAASTGAVKASVLGKPRYWPVLVRIWMRAVDRAMDALLSMLWAAGIPQSPLAPLTLIPAKKPPPSRVIPKFYSLASLTSSVSILSSSSMAPAEGANQELAWLHKNYKDWMISRFPSFLQVAVAFGRTPLVSLMMESVRRQGLVQYATGPGWMAASLLHLAAAAGRGHVAISKILLDSGADPTLRLPIYQLLLAMRKILLAGRKKKRSNTPEATAKTWARRMWVLPVEVAAASRNFELVLLLLAHSIRRVPPPPPIRIGLLCQQDLEITIRLLKSGAMPAITDPFGNGPLHLAAAHGRPELIALYLHYGSPIDAANVHGCTALHEAARNRHGKTFRTLIQSGASCSILDGEGRTALEVARRAGFDSEFLQDCFHSKETTGDTNVTLTERMVPPDMESLIRQVQSYSLREDLSTITPSSVQQPHVQQQRKGRFLIEKIINPRQWWS